MAFITINKKNLISNINTIKQHLNSIKSKSEVALVLKDNAYGHGIKEIASIVKHHTNNIFVKNHTEAELIKNDFKNITTFYGIPNYVHKNIITTIHSIQDIKKIDFRLKDIEGLRVELKINVGMNRNGMLVNELIECIDFIVKKKIDLVGIFSHNGYSDNLEMQNEFEKNQNEFEKIKEMVRYITSKQGIKVPRFHSLNSSGALRVRECNDDLVRIGIAMYGYLCVDLNLKNNLIPILKLYANKISTKILKKGSKIGYSGMSEVDKKTIVSTYDIGYGDGFYRLNGKKKVFLPNGKEILPITSMDCFSAYTNEDEICVMENADYIARVFDTIPYEVLTRMSPFIERKII